MQVPWYSRKGPEQARRDEGEGRGRQRSNEENGSGDDFMKALWSGIKARACGLAASLSDSAFLDIGVALLPGLVVCVSLPLWAAALPCALCLGGASRLWQNPPTEMCCCRGRGSTQTT